MNRVRAKRFHDLASGDQAFISTDALRSSLTAPPTAETSLVVQSGQTNLPPPNPTLVGDANNNTLNGTSGDDYIQGLGGNDSVYGLDGDDRLEGGDGNDYMEGGGGSDVIDGGAGDDYLYDLWGGEDQLFGGEGNDQLSAGRDSSAPAGSSTMLLDGGAGADTINISSNTAGRTLTVNVVAGDGDDQVWASGTGVRGSVDLGAGNDHFFLVCGGLSTVTLGSGVDRIELTSVDFVFPQATVITDFATGSAGDIIQFDELARYRLTNWNGTNPFSSGHARLIQSGANVLFQIDFDGGANSWTSILQFNGTQVAQFNAINFAGYVPDGSSNGLTYVGTAARDVILGSTGNDIIQGLDGNDELDGSEGNDNVQGGAGDDQLFGGLGSDTLSGGDGNDLIYLSAVDTATGDAGDDHVVGNLQTITGVNDSFDGGAGDDRIELYMDSALQKVTALGGDGADMFTVDGPGGVTLNGGAGDDRFTLTNIGTAAKLTLGSGVDIVTLAAQQTTAPTVTITDFQTGLGGDRLDLGAYLNTALSGWDHNTNPFAINLLRLTQSGSSTILQLNDGGAWRDLVVMQNTTVANFRAENLSGYPADGSTPPGFVIMGQDGEDDLYGGVGPDQIYGGYYDDNLFGGAGDDYLSGGEWTDNLDGGTGNDTLWGGPGGVDVMTGGSGADNFVYVRGDGFDDIRDFNAAEDKFVVYDYDTWSVQQVGADTYVNFGELGGEGFRLVNTLASSVTSANFEFHPGDAIPAPWSITPPAGVSSSPAQTVNTDTVLAAGGKWYFAGPTGFWLQQLPPDPSPTISPDLTNAGSITVMDNANSQFVVGIRNGDSGFYFESLVTNAATGVIRVQSTGNLSATYGFFSMSWSADFTNNGLLEVVALDGNAAGVISYSSGFDFINTGAIHVWGDEGGGGAGLMNGGTFNNSGTIEAYGDRATGASVSGDAFTFHNSGTIIAESRLSATMPSNGLFINDWGFGEGFDREIYNSGLIRGDYSIFTSETEGQPSRDFIFNSGTLDGDVYLAQGDDILHNTGTITGAIDLYDGDDIYDGASGIQSGGAIYLGYGDDHATGGNSAETFYGGEGVDVIDGGGGDDWIDGGRGADILTGGSGFDTLSFVTAYGAVTVNLATATAVAYQADVISGFERVVGGRFGDTLTGATGAETLEGREGDDVLDGGSGNDTLLGGLGADTITGGAGNDAIVFTKGDGKDTVIGFTAGGADDRIVLYGYANYISLTQVGGDTLITLGPDDSILLKGVTASALTSADFVFNIGVAPGASPYPADSFTGFDTIFAPDGYQIAAGEHIDIAGHFFGIDAGALVTNHGLLTVHMESTEGPTTGVVSSGDGFINAADGVLQVTESGLLGTAVGYGQFEGRGGAYVTNAGLIEVTGGGYATGVEADLGLVFDNTGVIRVSAGTKDAWGVRVSNGVDFHNSGDMLVSSEGGAAIGVSLDVIGDFVNTGNLIVTTNSAQPSVGVLVNSPFSSPEHFLNYGLIDADIAFKADPSRTSIEILHNFGTLRGAVQLGDGSDMILNAGLIDGRIDLWNGDDVYDGALGTVTGLVYAGSGNDRLIGGAGSETLFGEDGADVLIGGGGADILDGGAGNDTIVYRKGFGQDVVNGFVAGGTDDHIEVYGYGAYTATQQGSDTLVTFAAGDTLLLKGVTASALTSADFVFKSMISGTAGADTLNGTSGGERIEGLDGNDVLKGGAGADELDGGAGIDTADYSSASGAVSVSLAIYGPQDTGPDGTDTLLWIENLRGSNFSDRLTGDFGANKLEGLGGDDILVGGQGDDVMDGGAGIDTADYSAAIGGANVSLTLSTAQNTGWAGFDTLLGIENLIGGVWGDTLTGNGGDNLLDGSYGDDRLQGGAGNDTLIGGGGTDTVDYSGAGAGVTVDLNLEIAQNTGGAGIDTLTGFESAIGTAFNDVITGGNVYGELHGGGGDDILKGQYLDGGTGIDTADFTVSIGSLAIDLATGAAMDWTRLRTLISIENVWGGSFDDVLTGDANANLFTGGAGTDVLSGAGGDDDLAGGLGNDSLDGGAGNDTFRFAVGDGQDTITGFTAGGTDDRIVIGYSSYTLQQVGADTKVVFDANNWILLKNVQSNTLTAADFVLPVNILNGTGSGETLTGTAGVDQISGLGGNDILKGLAANDSLDGGDGDDSLDGGEGNDLLTGGLGIDTADYSVAASAVSVNLSLATAQNTGGAGTDTLGGIENIKGSAFNDTLTGDAGANNLQGLNGNDTLRGGMGADSLDGGAGNDTFVFAAGDGTDTIAGFTAGGTDDAIQVTGYASYNLQQIGADLKIIFDANNSILLLGVSAASFTAADVNIPIGFNLMTGTVGPDTLTGTGLPDQIDGLAGADTLKGGDGNDLLYGGDGNDILEGGLGDDLLDGGLGIDKADYRAAASAVIVNLSILTAQNTVAAGMDTITGVEDILGSAFNDSLTGDAGSNSLQGKAGNDQLFGGDGGDTLVGGAGADALNGGAGLDYASYGDALAGVGLNLTTGVHAGDALGDTFVSIERYRLSSFNDVFVGGAGTDQVYGNDGNDTLSGAGGIDKLYGQNNNDTLNGDAGNDVLIGGAGADTFNGGADRDTASFEDMTVAVTLDLTGATSTLDAIGDVFNSIEIFWLTAFNDTFIGSSGDDEVRGWTGNDTLNGMDGSDRLRGEDGADTLNGGDGDDFLWGDAGADTLNGGNGTDTVCYTYAKLAGVSVNLTTGIHTGEAAGDSFVSVERFQLTNQSTLSDSFTGSAGNDWVAGYKGVDNLFGLDGNDTLNGGEHNDVLDGGNGADKLYGGTGNDQETGGAGADQFIVNAKAFGADVVTDFENGVDKIRVVGVAGWDDFSDVAVSANGSGWAVITFPDGSTITLTGVTASDVDASDFLWS